ncbi:MAG: cell envelope biogenesis protein LolA [Bacteroidetes bacterium HGW-Bacteroidetes-21]|jgi:outer membrane lipoprotein-sorting protein|nr:MAG: cell envelope biogenesis protein LolA [Bacteroidetes bacterium HGW-Bacteroidetes-21]
MKSIFSFLLLVFCINAYAQQPQEYKEVDPKAKAILDKVSAKTKAYTSIEAEFAFILENKQENIKDTQKGRIWIKGNKYKVDMQKIVSFYDGKTLNSYMKSANEVTVTEPDPNDDNTLNPAKIFTIYEKGYKIRYIAEKFEDSRQLQEIDLYPIDLKKDFSRITLRIDKAKSELYSMVRYGKDGNTYTIKLISMKSNEAYTDALFVFDKTKYPKVEVIDMRD